MGGALSAHRTIIGYPRCKSSSCKKILYDTDIMHEYCSYCRYTNALRLDWYRRK